MLAASTLDHGSIEFDRLTAEARALGQALDVENGLLVGLFTNRGVYHGMAGRRPQSVAYFREAMLADLPDMRASEDPQHKATVQVAEAFTAAACRQPRDALRHARAALAYADVIAISYDGLRWAWPLAARAAFGLGDISIIRELLGQLDGCQPGQLGPMLRAERDLVSARLAVFDDPTAEASFAAAVSSLRVHSTPYHLAHGLLDHARHLMRLGDTESAALAVSEASELARRLRCQPLLDRAAEMTAALSRIPA